jgi:DNA-binding protein H-NS
MRDALQNALAELADAEREHSDMLARLRGLPREADELWIQRRAALESNAAQLGALVEERSATYARLVRSIRYALDQAARAQELEVEQDLELERQRYQHLLRTSRERIGALERQKRTYGTVRAQARDPITVERRLGRQVTPDAPKPDRAAEREARNLVAAHLRGPR